MKLLISVKRLLGSDQFDLETDISIELPYHEFIEKLEIKKLLDQRYSEWLSFEIDLYEVTISAEQLQKEKDEIIADFGFD